MQALKFNWCPTRYEMQDKRFEILVWLPSPVGDAVLCTPALRVIRQHFKTSQITFFANPVVREVLSPSRFNDVWLQQESNNPFAIANILRPHKFTHAILFKNSFASALAVFLAGIPSRIGYSRQGRAVMITHKLHPPKISAGKFRPFPMIDYYLEIASSLGADTPERNLELSVDPREKQNLQSRLPELFDSTGPIIVLVPGGAFGPSKCWPGDRFAQTADWLISTYNATVVVSVSQAPLEMKVAKEICQLAGRRLINLAETPITLGQLKSLFSIADLVITNDTGPRHIAIALRRKLITLFGPNDPAWTDTGCENEIKIIGDVPCAPCARPVCKEKQHFCMQAITVEMVCDAAKKLLENDQRQPISRVPQKFKEISKSVFIDADYERQFSRLGLTSIDAVFDFNTGTNLTKDNLSKHRSRLQFQVDSPQTTLFLKRYDRPPVSVQFRNWLSAHRRISCGLLDFEPADKLTAMGINTPMTIAYGFQWGRLFEKRSFCITEKIPNAESLERKLPDYFNAPPTAENLRMRRDFIRRLAAFIKKFHETNYRHRDLYLSHIFYSDDGRFHLIDLARAFKPFLLAERFRVKDIAQVYYSAPGNSFSGTDRLRFYFALAGRSKLTVKDKAFIRKVINKAKRIARHDIKHGRTAPFEN